MKKDMIQHLYNVSLFINSGYTYVSQLVLIFFHVKNPQTSFTKEYAESWKIAMFSQVFIALRNPSG